MNNNPQNHHSLSDMLPKRFQEQLQTVNTNGLFSRLNNLGLKEIIEYKSYLSAFNSMLPNTFTMI